MAVRLSKRRPRINNAETVSNSNPGVVAKIALTAQSAAKTATTMYTVPAGGAGCYLVTWGAAITTAGAVSSTLGGSTSFQVTYTDPVDSVVKTTVAPVVNSAANTTGTAIGGALLICAKAATAIQYAFGYTDGGTTPMQYRLNANIIAIG